MLFAASVFFASLFGLALLFSLKAVEAKRGAIYMPTLRARGDDAARTLKSLLADARVFIGRIPPLLVILGRLILRELALATARLARLAETQSHRIADLVSHKRSFEKREPRSEFLKQVSEMKNGNGHDETKEV